MYVAVITGDGAHAINAFGTYEAAVKAIQQLAIDANLLLVEEPEHTAEINTPTWTYRKIDGTVDAIVSIKEISLEPCD